MKKMDLEKRPAHGGELKRHEANPFEELSRSMDRIFEGFMKDFGLKPGQFFGGRELAWPEFKASETEEAFHLEARKLGMEAKDIELSVDDGVLYIFGEKREEKEAKGKGRQSHSEFSYGSFEKAFTLPANVDEEGISAKFEKGVLNISMPKLAESKKKGKAIHIAGS